MLHKEIPFLRIGLPFWTGIISGLYFEPDQLFFIVTGILIILTLTVIYFSASRSSGILYGFILNLALFISGLYLYTGEKMRIAHLESNEMVFAGYIDDFPQEKANSYSLIFRIEKLIDNHTDPQVSGGILIYHRKDSTGNDFRPGDRLLLKCRPLEVTNRGNPYEFNYRQYMLNQGVRYYAFTDSSDITGHYHPENLKLRHIALITREKIIGMFRKRGITGDELALVSAMTLGQKDLLDNDQKEVFIKAGVMHIMAVSGLHAVILSIFIFRLLFFLKGRYNFIRILLALLLLWTFTFVTGLTPSVLRATIMFTFLQAGKSMERQVNGINSVLASAFVLAIMKPSVIFEAGFLLSYSAVIFIVGFYRELYCLYLPKRKLPDLIWQSAAVTLVAQAGTLPLTIMMFNRFPTLFLLTNIIIVPLSSIVIIAGFVVVITYPFPLISGFIASLLSRLTWLTEYLTEKASSVPFSTIENIGLTPLKCLFLTMLILFLALSIFSKRKVPVFLPLSFLLLYISAGTMHDSYLKRSNELIVYNARGKYTVGIRKGKVLHIISDTVAGKEVLRHSAMLDLKVENHISGTRPPEITVGSIRIRISNGPDDAFSGRDGPDVVIVNGTSASAIRMNKAEVKPAVIIFGNEVRQGYSLRRQLESIAPDTVHFMRDRGAFTMRL